MRVAAFTGGQAIPSARFRVRQLIAPLHEQGIDVTEFCAKFSSWPPEQHLQRYAWLAATLMQRIPSVLRSHGFDLVLLQREMVSTLATLERFTKHPRVMDVDDAVWLHPRGENFNRILRRCDAAICGNSFLAAHVGALVPNILTLPTLVDTKRFLPSPPSKQSDSRFVIGWSGSRSGEKYLLGIEKPLKTVLDLFPQAMLRVVSDARPAFSMLPHDRIEFVRWSPAVEVSALQDLTVGLMPIDDSPWSRGKCSYKMLLYMACGVPVVVSPYGMNVEVLEKSELGFGARTEDNWVDSIRALLEDAALCRRLGDAGRSVVEDHYSIEAGQSELSGFLHKVAGLA